MLELMGNYKKDEGMKAGKLTGKQFGYLQVTYLSNVKNNQGRSLYKCLCTACNSFTYIHASDFKTQKSCGCMYLKTITEKSTKHGMHKTKTYTSYQSMKARCLNANYTQYNDYGGRGIKVCDRWLESFENFLEDMGERPERMTLDRINVNGNYEPNNCKWSTYTEQAKNKRNVNNGYAQSDRCKRGNNGRFIS